MPVHGDIAAAGSGLVRQQPVGHGYAVIMPVALQDPVRSPSSVVVLGKFRRFHFPILSICSPEPRFFPYLLQIFNALSELFLLKKIFRYVIIIVLYRTFSEGGYGLLFKKRKEEKRDIFTNV